MTNVLALPLPQNNSPVQTWNQFIDSKPGEKTRLAYQSRLRIATQYAGYEYETDFLYRFENDPTNLASIVMNSMLSSGKNEIQRKPVLSLLSNYGNWLHSQGVISFKPEIKLPKEQKTWVDRLETVTEADISMLNNWIDGQPETIKPLFHAILEGLYFRGLRRSELLSIRICDIDKTNKRVSIVEKGHPVVWNPIPVSDRFILRLEELTQAIRNLEPRVKETNFIFIAPSTFSDIFVRSWFNGAIPAMNEATLNRIIQSWGEAINIRLAPHMFRHGIATRLVSMGKNVREVAAFLRQSSATVQERYFDSVETTARAVIDIL